jgi:hypothetical protein
MDELPMLGCEAVCAPAGVTMTMAAEIKNNDAKERFKKV